MDSFSELRDQLSISDTPQPAAEVPSVLVIDDNAAIAAALNLVLDGAFKVSTCCSSRVEDVRACLHDDVRVILLDIKMAPNDGIALFDFIRQTRSDVRIIFHSAYPGGQERADLAAKLPHSGYLTKGDYTTETLMQVISSAMH